MTESEIGANTPILTYRYRVKDKHAAELNRMAHAVNFVWNFCNDTQKHALKWNKPWPTAIDLIKQTAGSSILLGIRSNTIDMICVQYAKSRRQHRKAYLRYRGKKSLGWVPLRSRSIRPINGGFCCFGKDFAVWLSRPIPEGATIKDGGSFARDAQGHWYINVVLEMPVAMAREPNRLVGIDLGLKDIACLSSGVKVAAPRLYVASERRLGKANRAKKRRLVRSIGAKVKNQRKDFLHKLSAQIVRDHDLIIVGNVNSSSLAKTRMAKPVLDAGWSSFRSMLAYKAIKHGARYAEVNEAYSTQACSECGCISGPKGRKGLVIREWACSDCGTVHDRDVNAARNILRYEHVSPLGRVA